MGFLAGLRTDVLDEMTYYLVDAPDGSVGVIDGCKRDEHGRPDALVAARGWLRRRRFAIPIGTLREVDHGRRRVLVAGDAEPAPSTEAVRPVVCGVSPDRPAVLAVAARLAGTLEVPLVLGRDVPLADADSRGPDALAVAMLSRLVWDAGVKRVVARRAPAETVEGLARREDAQLLVIGPGRVGSLGEPAPCPIVVVPPGPTASSRDTADVERSARTAYPEPLRARLGATRGGSSGCFG
jgi:hypothetical protein